MPYLRRVLNSCSLALLLALTPALQAALIVQETFVTGAGNYTANGNLAGQTSSASQGFTGAWGGAGTSYATVVASPNLTMSGVNWNTGGSVRIQTNSDFYASREQDRNFTSAVGSTSLWFSTLYQPSTIAFDADRETMMAFLTDPVPGKSFTSTTTPSNATDALWSNTNGIDRGGFAWGISTFGDTSNTLTVKYQSDLGGTDNIVTADTNIALAIGTTYMLIAELALNTTGATDMLNIWAVTSLPTSQASLGAPHWTVSADILSTSASLDTLAFLEGTSIDGVASAAVTYYDAIRIGTTFDDLLLAVPEPSRALLLFVTLSALSLRRRRA